jgi:hypothetical protein
MLDIPIKLRKVRLGIALAAAASLLVVTSNCGFVKEFDRSSVPIPVDIDGQLVHCPLYLNVEMKSYNVPFDKFAAGSMDEARTMFVTAVQAIRQQDAAKFASVWTSPDQMKRLSQKTTVRLVDNSAESWINVARSNFDFDNLTVVAEVLVGSETMFVWESATKFGPRRDAFYVGFDQKDQLRLSIVSSNAPVMSLIKSAFDAVGRPGGDAYKPLQNINLPYRYPIPLAGKGNPGTHPVVLEFDGSPMDFSITDEKVKPPTPLLEFLRNAALAIRSGQNDVFSSDFTPKSQEKMRQWLAAIEAHKQARQQQMAAPPASNPDIAGLLLAMEANVKFVINADSIYLVFQYSVPGDNWTPEHLWYSYVLHEGGTYKIANFSFSDDFDGFLQDPALFDKNILKSANRPSK